MTRLIYVYQQVESSNAGARYVADLTKMKFIFEPCAGLGKLTALCAYQNKTPLKVSDLSAHCIELKHLYHRHECPVPVIVEQGDVTGNKKDIRGNVDVCNLPYDRPEDPTLGCRMCYSRLPIIQRRLIGIFG